MYSLLEASFQLYYKFPILSIKRAFKESKYQKKFQLSVKKRHEE